MIPGLFFPYVFTVLFSAFVAFYHRKYLASRQLIIMLPYLFLVFVQEIVLGLASILDYYARNALVYNIYRPVSVFVFAYVYYRLPFMKPVRKIIVWATGIYFIATLIDYFFIESILTTSIYLTLARGFLITFFAVLFLFRYFELDDLDEEKFWRPLIWITIGVTTFYPVISVSISFQQYLSDNKATLFGYKVYNIIPQVMSIFMYSCFSYAFYLCKKKRSISLSS
jgi:hypothetical protein